jgi:hypothetical protein
MPRYFFHVADRTSLTEDNRGEDLPSLEAARHEALQTTRELWGSLSSDEVWEEMVFIIMDEKNETVLVVPFRNARTTHFAGRALH